MKMSVAGLAARKEDAAIVKHLWQYQKMLDIASNMVVKHKVEFLCSGGAAWADHLVVSLGLLGVISPKNITLYLPAEFDGQRYRENGEKFDTGRTTNYYHRRFSDCIKRDTLSEIAMLQRDGATLVYNPGGFQARNTDLARFLSEEDILLAYTVGRNDTPSKLYEVFDGTGLSALDAGLKITKGTADTWKKSNSRKFHIKVG